LNDLGLDYLDLYLIHFPISLKYVPFEKRYPPEWFHDPEATKPCMELIDVPVQSTWKALETLVDDGHVRNIGLSNFNCQGIRDVMSYARIKPSVLQVELHPYLQQANLVRYTQSLGIHVTAYSPMGHGASYWNESIAAIREPVVKELAAKHGIYLLCLWFCPFNSFVPDDLIQGLPRVKSSYDLASRGAAQSFLNPTTPRG
jgi:D-xylose reductase